MQHVAKMLGKAVGSTTALVMELCSRWSVTDFFQAIEDGKEDPLSFYDVVNIAVDASAGVLCLHRAGVVHKYGVALVGGAVSFFSLSLSMSRSFSL